MSINYFYNIKEVKKISIAAERLETIGDIKQDNGYSNPKQIYKSTSNINNILNTIAITYKLDGKLKRSGFTAGVKLADLTNATNSKYVFSMNDSPIKEVKMEDYKYKERVSSVFSKYSFSEDHIKADIGIRFEYTSSASSISRVSLNNKKYLDFFPEIGVHFIINKIKNKNLTINYNQFLFRPTSQSLNPLKIQINDFTSNSGNIDLKPSYSKQVTMNFVFSNNISSVTEYLLVKNSTFLIGSVDQGSGTINNEQEDGLKEKGVSQNVEYLLKVNKAGQLKLRAGISLSNARYSEKSQSNTRYNFGVTGAFSLPFNISIISDLSVNSGSTQLFYDRNSTVYCNLNLTKSLFKQKISIAVQALDIFNSSGRQQTNYHYPQYLQKMKNAYRTSSFLFRIALSITKGSKSAVGRHNIVNTDKDRINIEN